MYKPVRQRGDSTSRDDELQHQFDVLDGNAAFRAAGSGDQEPCLISSRSTLDGNDKQVFVKEIGRLDMIPAGKRIVLGNDKRKLVVEHRLELQAERS